MYPIICHIGPFTVYSYGLMLVIAFIVSAKLACLQAKRHNISPETIFNLLFTGFILGVIGARLFFVIENITYYLKNPVEIVMLQEGGLSWFGGLIFGLTFAASYLHKKNLSIYKVLDLLIPFLALGQAIGRVGCLLNGCCFGATLIPTQLYSSLLLILIFIILRFLQERPHRQGRIFFTYLLLYSLKRFFIEFWRADSELIFFDLTLFQIISTVIFFISLAKLILIKKSPV